MRPSRDLIAAVHHRGVHVRCSVDLQHSAARMHMAKAVDAGVQIRQPPTQRSVTVGASPTLALPNFLPPPPGVIARAPPNASDSSLVAAGRALSRIELLVDRTVVPERHEYRPSIP